jgi:hypothetical protein
LQKHVASVTTRTGNLVDQIVFFYTDGSFEAYGDNGGLPQEPFVLHHGEYLVAVHVRSGELLDSVQFETNTGRVSAVYGGDGGAPHTFRAVSGHSIIGLERNSEYCSCISGIQQQVLQRCKRSLVIYTRYLEIVFVNLDSFPLCQF